MIRSRFFAPVTTTVIPAFFCVLLCSPPTPAAFGADPGQTPKHRTRPISALFRAISDLPRPKTFKPAPDATPYLKLTRHLQNSLKFREAIAPQLFPLRATTVPRPPLNPRFVSVAHGVAIYLHHPMGPRWTTSASLVADATYAEIRDQDGQWHKVESRRPCEYSLLTILEGIPDEILAKRGDVPVRNKRREAEKQPSSRAFDLRNPDVLTEALPVLAITNIEGSSPTLHLGALKDLMPSEVGQNWSHSLRVSPGTPLLDIDGRIVLIQIASGQTPFATSPQDGFRCAPGLEHAAGKGRGQGRD